MFKIVNKLLLCCNLVCRQNSQVIITFFNNIGFSITYYEMHLWSEQRLYFFATLVLPAFCISCGVCTYVVIFLIIDVNILIKSQHFLIKIVRYYPLLIFRKFYSQSKIYLVFNVQGKLTLSLFFFSLCPYIHIIYKWMNMQLHECILQPNSYLFKFCSKKLW